MTALAEMFTGLESMTFEERVAEIIAIVSSAADFAGADYRLRYMFEAMYAAHDEREFDEAFDRLLISLSENPAHSLQAASSRA
jgi:hypothetical protein